MRVDAAQRVGQRAAQQVHLFKLNDSLKQTALVVYRFMTLYYMTTFVTNSSESTDAFNSVLKHGYGSVSTSTTDTGYCRI